MTASAYFMLGTMLYASILTIDAMAGAPPNAGEGKRGFVVTRFQMAMYEGKTGRTANRNKSDGLPECPEGFNVGPDRDAVLAKLPPAERERLRRPENAQFLGEAYWLERHRGANNRDVCDHP